MDIPKDFDSKWEFSDVILIAEDAEGSEKELHANRLYLATYSSVFKSMFFSSFKEANSESVKVSFYIINIPLDTGVLANLYKAGDYLDFPAIRKMCLYQMINRHSVEMATAVLGVAAVSDELHATLMRILMNLSLHDIKKFLSVEDSQLLFSKKDVKQIYEWITKKELPKPEKTYQNWTCLRSFPDFSNDSKNALIDCTQKWPRSDIRIKTKNSNGKKLYSNKTVLAMVSPHFAQLFFGSPDSMHKVIKLDVDYMIMKNILTILHHCHNDSVVLKAKIYLIYNMYRAASRDNLDIPVIRSICVKGLAEGLNQFTWEIATSLKFDVDDRLMLAEKIDTEEVLEWLFNVSDTVPSAHFTDCSSDDKRYVVYHASEKKSVISLSEVRVLVEKLIRKYNK